MTPEQLRAAAKVMEAAAEGKKLESRFRGSANWKDASFPGFDWISNEYRIKVEPLKIPVRLFRHRLSSAIQPFNVLTPISPDWEPCSSAIDVEVRE